MDFLLRNINVTVGIEYIDHYRLAVDVGGVGIEELQNKYTSPTFFYLMYLKDRLKTIQSTPLLRLLLKILCLGPYILCCVEHYRQ